MFDIQTFFSVASPATLASLIADLRGHGDDGVEHNGLEAAALRALNANVSAEESAKLIDAARCNRPEIRENVRPVGPDAKALRAALKRVDAREFGRLRELFYRIADSAKPLADLLERVDADQAGDKDGAPLLAEHFVFAEVVEVLKGSKLGGAL
jgi:hypothetical protein